MPLTLKNFYRQWWWWTLAQSLWIYRPLREDANDHKLDVWWTWTVSNAIWNGTASYTTVWSIQSAHFAHNYNSWSYVTSSYLRKDIPITIAAWVYATTWYSSNWQTILTTQDSYSDGGNKKIWIWLWDQYRICVSNGGSSDEYKNINAQEWVFAAISIDNSGNWIAYLWDTKYTGTWWLSMTFDKRWQVWNWGSNGFYWNIRDVAIWERALSQSEMLEYKALTQ